jgi:transcriptional regulator with XRE-family HTH domain
MYFDDIGQTILHARKKQKLSQQQLSSQLGMSRATISAIEKGTIPEIGIRKIMAICAVLGLELIVQEKVSRPTLQQLIREQQRA